MKKNYALFIFIFVTISSFIAQSQQFTVEKMWSLNRLSGTQVSPDEAWVFHQITNYDYSQNRGNTVNLLMDTKSKSVQSIPIQGSWNHAWNAKNQLTFLIELNGKTAIQSWDPISKTASTIYVFDQQQVDGIVFSADGTRFASLESIKIKQTVADTYPDLPLATGRVEDNLMYRHWNAWSTPNVLHLFWYEKTDNAASFILKGDVMKGEPFPSVTGPFGGIESVTFSKDGKTIFYSTKKKAGKDFALSTNSDIYAFNTYDATTVNFTASHKGYDNSPSFHSNGKYLAWLSMEKDGFEADKNRLRVYNFETKQEVDLTAGIDVSVDQFTWNPSKEVVYFTAALKGCKQLFSVDIPTGKILQLTTERSDIVHLSARKDLIYIERQSMINPTDLWAFTPKTGLLEQLTKVNQNQLSSVAEPTVQEKWITTTDGKKMLTWVIFPPNYDPAKKYPTLLYCQGGPQSPVSQYFSYRWNFRLMASQGYIIVAPNRRGLPGFGQDWNDAISKDWGGQAMRDYLVAIDSCVAQIPSIDASKLGAVGASYGGYSVYYLAGIHNNRFKTFVSHCGLFNLESWYGTTEELFFADWDIGGPYWKEENKELFLKNSPHKLVDKWNTPMLVIHGGKDFRVPESEGMQAFQALQLKGIPSKYLYFPDEGHWITKPQNGILWYREYFKWLDTYLK